MPSPELTAPRPLALGMTSYQWTVLLAAWLGWGFDVFDGLLFNYVAPNCIPFLLHLTPGTPAARSAYVLWNGIMTSLLLLGWAAGGIIFGRLGDQFGRTKTLLATILIYAVCTACCALSPNIWFLMAFRFLAGLGIGGEWAAGSSLVAEAVPENRRVEAGALLYTSAPCGLFLATFVNFKIAGDWLKSQPDLSWRYVFLAGLIPAAIAFAVRLMVKEPEMWQRTAGQSQPKIRELFAPEMRKYTISGMIVAITALIMWWSTNAFIATLVSLMASVAAKAHGLDKVASQALTQGWIRTATNAFNWGGLLGTLMTIPLSKMLGRKPMYAIYFALSAVALFVTFGPNWPPETRLNLYFLNGLTVFGVFGSFTYYLPELFPTRLRATGSGFCYNIGRIVTSVGPFAIGVIVSQGASVQTLHLALATQFWIGVAPLVGLLFLPWVIETKGMGLRE